MAQRIAEAEDALETLHFQWTERIGARLHQTSAMAHAEIEYEQSINASLFQLHAFRSAAFGAWRKGGH
jgi:hypothetical protein